MNNMCICPTCKGINHACYHVNTSYSSSLLHINNEQAQEIDRLKTIIEEQRQVSDDLRNEIEITRQHNFRLAEELANAHKPQEAPKVDIHLLKMKVDNLQKMQDQMERFMHDEFGFIS